MIFSDDHPTRGSDIWAMSLPGGDPRPLVIARGDQFHATLSPDERWLAYSSNESGPFEIYVRPFPDDGRWVVSTGGGWNPVWSPTGRDLFYLNGTTMMSVPVDGEGATFTAGVPEALFTGPFETGSLELDIFRTAHPS